MKPAFDLTSVRLTLRDGISKGYWTLEQLDAPTPGYKQLVEEIKHHKVLELRSFPVPPCRNLLRDEPVVERAAPRDIAPASGPTPAEQPPLPVTLEVDHAPTPTIDADLDDLPF